MIAANGSRAHRPRRRSMGTTLASWNEDAPRVRFEKPMYNNGMERRAIHISEAEAAKDLPSLLARVRAGAEIVIERDAEAVAVIRPAEPHVRLLSESLRLARERGSKSTLDGGFGRDLENVVNSHREALTPPVWD